MIGEAWIDGEVALGVQTVKRVPKYKPIPTDSVDVSDWNVRKVNAREGLEELAQSIREIGLQQPIVVYEKEGRYHVIIGQRRFLACKMIGLTSIPALVTHVKDETAAAIVSFSENIHRLDLDYRDKMRAAVMLHGALRSVRAVAERLGVSDQTVRNYLGYAGVPDELKDLVSKGKLSAQAATRIAQKIPDPKRALEIAKEVTDARTSDRRRMIVDIAHEHPSLPGTQIREISQQTRYSKITLNLTPRLARSLKEACGMLGSDPEVVAQDALEEWLQHRGFLR